jgi:hypothetical protein
VSAVQSLFVFIGIPVAFAAVVAVLVYASSWTRSGRVSDDYDAGPFLVVSDPALPDPSRLPSELAEASGIVAGGGVSARW